MLAGVLAAGCASQQAAQVQPPRPAATAEQKTQARSPREVCLQRKTNVQECLIEAIAKGCQSQEKAQQCMEKGLGQERAFPGEARTRKVLAYAGEEVLSLRFGRPPEMGIAKLEVDGIDGKGAAFMYIIRRVDAHDPRKGEAVEEIPFRVNYDGTSSGDGWKLNGLGIWDLKVKKSGKGVQVNFATTDSRITIRQ